VNSLLIFVDAKSFKKMNYTMSFQERAKLGLEQLSKQSPVTLAMARKQAQLLKLKSIIKNKRKRD
jgi:hypothetical protein